MTVGEPLNQEIIHVGFKGCIDIDKRKRLYESPRYRCFAVQDMRMQSIAPIFQAYMQVDMELIFTKAFVVTGNHLPPATQVASRVVLQMTVLLTEPSRVETTMTLILAGYSTKSYSSYCLTEIGSDWETPWCLIFGEELNISPMVL